MTSKPYESVFHTDPRRVARLFDASESDGERFWRPEELAAVLRHQLSAPLRVDIAGLACGSAARLKTLAESQGLLLKSFGDLLHHPCPPLELLEETKQFAKTCRISPQSPVPKDVAAVLYFASIAVAMTRCGRRISALSRDELTRGFRWVAEQSWVDEKTRGLISEAVAILPESGEGVDD
jgi:hypothetical protein